MNSENPEQNSDKIAELLKHGAHSLIAQEDAKAKEGEAFANEDIAEILAQRTEKRQIGNRAGNTFSTAQFTADLPQVCARKVKHVQTIAAAVGCRQALLAMQGGSDRDYWAGLMPDDVAAFEAKVRRAPLKASTAAAHTPEKRRAHAVSCCGAESCRAHSPGPQKAPQGQLRRLPCRQEATPAGQNNPAQARVARAGRQLLLRLWNVGGRTSRGVAVWNAAV